MTCSSDGFKRTEHVDIAISEETSNGYERVEALPIVKNKFANENVPYSSRTHLFSESWKVGILIVLLTH